MDRLQLAVLLARGAAVMALLLGDTVSRADPGEVRSPATSAPLRLEPLGGTGSSLTWQGRQFLGADRRGRVFLLRAETLEVFPLVDGEPGEPILLKSSGLSGAAVLDAAMGDDPGEWLLIAGFDVLRFADGKAAALPEVPWHPDSVAIRRGDLIAGVMPVPQRKAAPGFVGERDLPLLARSDGSRWDVWREEPYTDAGSEDLRFRMNDLRARRGVEMAADAAGKLWIAHGFRYRVIQLSPAGRPLQEIAIEGTAPEMEDEEAGNRKLRAQLTRQGIEADAASAFTARRAIYAVAPARDGRVYLLVRPAGGEHLALDRYDAVRGVVERAPLDLGEVSQRFDMVAGKDGLYLAAFSGRAGRWRISWEALEQAAWKAAPGVEVQGGVSAGEGG